MLLFRRQLENKENLSFLRMEKQIFIHMVWFVRRLI